MSNPLEKLKPRQQAWLEYYLTTAKLNATEAARLAGYQTPTVDGPRLRKNLKEVIESEVLRREENKIVQAKESLEIISLIARDSSHKDQLKAAELLAKIHGLLDTKIQITLERKDLMNQLDTLLRKLAPMLYNSGSPMLLPASTLEGLDGADDKQP